MSRLFEKLKDEVFEAKTLGHEPRQWHASKEIEAFYVSEEKRDATGAEILGLPLVYNGNLSPNEMLLETDQGQGIKFTVPVMIDLDAA